MSGKKNFLFLFSLLTFILLTYAPAVSASPVSERLMGNDRYLTATAVSQKGWPNGAATAILTTGENFPDALSAAPLAQKYNAPILLTESNSFDINTVTELKRLQVKKVYIIGGTGVISGDVDKQLALMGITSIRLAGQDRYETALKVAKEVGISKGVFVTTGLDFPDALSAAPVAAALGMPIILVPDDDLTSAQKSFLSSNHITKTFIVNGNSEISDTIVNQFPAPEVISGDDPYERNVNLLKRFADTLNFDTVYIATGNNFPDALSASALAQKGKNPIILLDDDRIPDSVSAYLGTKFVSTFEVLGGYGVITPTTETTLKTLSVKIQSVTDINQNIPQKQKYDLPKTVTATTADGQTTEVPVIWNLATVDTTKMGTYHYTGTVKGYNGLAHLTLTIQPILSKVDSLSAEIVLGGSYTLPDTVTALMSDNSTQDYPVTWNANLVTPNQTGTYTFQGIIAGISQKVTLTLKVSADTVVTFTDSNLEGVIRNKIGKYDLSKPLYKSDIIGIDYLDANGHGITDLTGLENLTNLKYLNLDFNHIPSAKLSTLGKLTNLQTLSLQSITGITNISALTALTKLKVLNLQSDSINDYTPLKGLIYLRQLYIKFNPGKDYSPLEPIYNNLTSKDFEL